MSKHGGEDRESLIRVAVAELLSELRGSLPSSGPLLDDWLAELAGADDPASYFLQPWGYPILLLPSWLASNLGESVDGPFQRAVCRSTVAGYFFIRLVDNCMDRQGAFNPALLPLAGAFHHEYERPYRRYFGAESEFWSEFRRTWFRTADVTVRDALVHEVDAAEFHRSSGLKMVAARIPVLAVCEHTGRHDLIAPWSEFCEDLSRTIQLVDDVFDWNVDRNANEGTTYFLCVAERHARAEGVSVPIWMAQSGFDLGLRMCADSFERLYAWIPQLECPQVRDILDHRRSATTTRGARARDALRKLIALEHSIS